MSDRETTTHDAAEAAAEERRSRKSAREVVEWETAFAAAKKQGDATPRAAVDRANAGAMVSRAHRAEKMTARPPGP
jgi:hypothetical protein